MPKRRPEVEGQEPLFPDADLVHPRQRRFKLLDRPLWTECKAALVAGYLYLFIQITKHGTYIDPFAGRQSDRAIEGWAVEEVLKIEPDWLRKYFLFERSRPRVAELEQLKSRFPGRTMQVIRGDSNVNLPQTLPVGSLGGREAAFCLLDQRTFECHWNTCRHVAAIKPNGYKIEQFYFLAQGWLDRALAGIKTDETAEQAEKWWGRPDWRELRDLSSLERGQLVANRFKDEFGYQEAYAWPIRKRGAGGGTVMYYMIHATDHPAAPALMRRAYDSAAAPVAEQRTQLELELQNITW